MAWLSGWGKRVPFTTDKNKVDENLTHFAVLAHLSATCGKGGAYDLSCVFNELGSDANRKKIAITKADGITQLYVEIEKWDHANKQAWLWLSKSDWTVLAAENTPLFIYYDSTHADNTTYVGDPSDAVVHNVWDSSFKLVYHMRDDPDTSHVRDSTVNAKDGTKKGAAEPAVNTAGKISDAQYWNGGDDYIDLGEGIVDCGADFTVSLWVYKHDTGKGIIFGQGHATLHTMLQLAIDASGYAEFFLRDDNDGETDDFTWASAIRDAWHRLTAVRDGNTLRLYVDGDEKNTAAYTQVDFTHTKGTIGAIQFYGGIAACLSTDYVDEVRCSDSARGAAWEKASYESERDDLLDWGSEETPSVAGRSFGFITG